jgi:6-phosphogluconate dehydrogenase
VSCHHIMKAESPTVSKNSLRIVIKLTSSYEFGMLQAIGEGVALLRQQNEFGLDIPQIFRNWSNGSVIRSWLVELMEKGLREQKDISNIDSYVEDTGEVDWLILDAINKEIPIPVICQSIMELFKSR